LAGGCRLATRSRSLSAKKTHMHSALSRKAVMAELSSALESSFRKRSGLVPSLRPTQSWQRSVRA
jgi:hypothetical protein